MSDEKDQLIEGHEYDGIKELDNPLPSWWLYCFFGTIIFSFIYYMHFEIAEDGLSSDQELSAKMEHIAKSKEKQIQNAPEVEEVDLTVLLKDKDKLSQGKRVYGQYCASCHGQKGEGVIGPNLTDEFWLHSEGDYEGVSKALVEGFPQKGMPPWGAVIPAPQQAMVVAYILTLKGSNPPNAKAPQGERKE